jgi:redox-sensitive bicupin YhaK (pirin superfamily)
MWVLPDTPGIDPGYEQRDLNGALAAGGLVAVASGRGHDGAVSIHQRDAVLWAGRLPAGATATIPDAPHVHLYVAVGSASLDEGAGVDLDAGDAVRLTAAGAHSLTAGPDGTEVLVWETA